MKRYQKERIDQYDEVCCRFEIKSSKWFGGVYFDEAGRLHLQVAEGFEDHGECLETVRLLGGREEVCVHSVKNSYRFLWEKGKEAMETARTDSLPGVCGWGVDERKNRVAVTLPSEGRSENKEWDDAIFDVRVGGRPVLHTELAPASRLSNGNGYFAAGYPVRKSGADILGFVTAGHLPGNAQGSEVTFDGQKIGTVYEYEHSERMDASFVRLEAGWVCGNGIAVPPSPKITGLCPTLIQGASVVMYGADAGKRYVGTVTEPDYHFWNMEHIVIFSYLSESGDSGSPVVLYHEDEDCFLVGIHLGSLFWDGKAYSFGRLADAINQCFSLELNV